MTLLQHKYGWAFPAEDGFMIGELKADGTYQANHYRAAMKYVRRCGVAVDGGAHVGTWARLMNADFAQVIAVEPSADTFAALTVNMEAFGCTHVELRHLALGATAGRVSMVLDGRALSLRNTGARWVTPGHEVACEPLDAWDLPVLDFLKLDVEGSEPFVLEGARATLARCHPVVLFEDKGLWKRFGQPRDAPHRILRQLGYFPMERVNMDEIWTYRKIAKPRRR